LPHFSTHHLHLSHGDDPYNQLTFTDPQYSMSELLLDQATYDNWFGSGVSDADKLKHVGKRTEELAIEYLPGYVLRAYCSDKANGKTHANGTVNGGATTFRAESMARNVFVFSVVSALPRGILGMEDVMNAADLLQKMGDTLGSTATVKSVFGEPIQMNGKTVVPVAKVMYGFGGGSGTGKNAAHPERQGEGGGGGGGVRAFPAGALEITENRTRFIPFIDPAWIGAAFAAGALMTTVMFLRRRK
jgi:uncharacterized spore protein YtfJ